MLDRVVKNESFLHIARDRAAALRGMDPGHSKMKSIALPLDLLKLFMPLSQAQTAETSKTTLDPATDYKEQLELSLAVN